MQYFKHSELANQYHVSLKTIHNWISAAKENRLDLKLHEAKSGTYVASTSENAAILGVLAEKGKKYRNSLHNKTIRPTSEFFSLYSERQILDIIKNLNTYREIPRQYNYLGRGANNWDDWLKKLEKDTSPNLLKGTVALLLQNMSAIDHLIEDDTRVNVIDLGVGNALPAKELLRHLLSKNILHRYIAIDISTSMLDIAENNIKAWFGDKVSMEKYARDITHERFDDIIIKDMLDHTAEKTINIVLLLGATPNNFPSFTSCFSVAYGSMSKNDLLIYTNKLDTEASRRYFDFSADPNNNIRPGISALSPSHKYLLDLMNITPEMYDVETGFDEKKYMRYIRIRLKTAITLQFEHRSISRSVSLEKGDTLLMMRYWHHSAQEIISIFESIGFMLLHSNMTNDRQFFLSISGLETKPPKEI